MNGGKGRPQLGRPVNEGAREKRLTQILDGARESFIRKGFHASSLSDISANAKVSVANIYQYFSCKEALITALIELDLQRHQALIARFWSSDFSRQAVEELLADLFLKPEGHAIAVLRAEIASEGARNAHVAGLLRSHELGLMEMLRERVRQAQERGQIASALDSEVVADRLSLVFEGIMRLYLFSPDDGEELIDKYYRQFADALRVVQ